MVTFSGQQVSEARGKKIVPYSKTDFESPSRRHETLYTVANSRKHDIKEIAIRPKKATW